VQLIMVWSRLTEQVSRGLQPLQTAVLAAILAAGRLLSAHLNAAIIALLAILAARALINPFEAWWLLTGDALYPIVMIDYSIFEFRPPPPNRLVPDVALHWLLSPFVADPLDQKIVAGSLLFLALSLIVGILKGLGVLVLVTAVMVSLGGGFLDSSSHYSLPLIVLMVLLASRSRRLDSAAYFIAAFANLMSVFLLAVLLVDPKLAGRVKPRALASVLGLLGGAFYADLGTAFLQVAAVLPVWLVVVFLAERWGLKALLCLLVAVALMTGAALGVVPERYAVGISASLAIMMTPSQAPSFDWRHIALPLAVLAIVWSTADIATARRQQAAFECLVTELKTRRIDTIAVDHWTAKPLYLAAKSRAVPLQITQTDFERGTQHPWMAPYEFFGAPTPWAVRNSFACGPLTTEDKYCGQASTARVELSEPVCSAFVLFRYASPIPRNFVNKPSSKLDAFARQLAEYIGKFIAILNPKANRSASRTQREPIGMLGGRSNDPPLINQDHKVRAYANN
jgi:hypothetical protein